MNIFMKMHICVLLVLITMMILPSAGCSEEGASGQAAGPLSIIEKAIDANSTVESYRAVFESASTFRGKAENNVSHIEFLSPDRYRQTSTNEEDSTDEYIRIGNTQYSRDSDHSFWAFREEESEIEFPPQRPGLFIRSEFSDYVDKVNWEELANENIDGTDCFHFVGEVDMNLAVDDMIVEIEEDQGELDAEQLRYMDQMRRAEQTIVLWIGTDDYIVRQERSVSRSLDPFRADEEERWFDATMLIRYYDFNAPIPIEAPADARTWDDLMAPTLVPEETITPKLIAE
ncbi:MAG: hypothetical protein PHV74_06840 [Dehalococcoidia bacterium]|nr:hypothetical protein [Dehalococcoidia bacterium]